MATKERRGSIGKGEPPSGREFLAPRTMTPGDLGDSLARLVWESFSDFIADGEAEAPLSELGVPYDDGVPDGVATEEALIFFLWAHTRGAQLAFVSRADEALLTRGLDVMHEAVFEDMVDHGTPRDHLPIFEHRVALRYAAYNQAAERSDQHLGRAVVRHLTGNDDPNPALERVISERAIAAADPLRDFLEDVELVDE